jgi:antitoxin HicB
MTADAAVRHARSLAQSCAQEDKFPLSKNCLPAQSSVLRNSCASLARKTLPIQRFEPRAKCSNGGHTVVSWHAKDIARSCLGRSSRSSSRFRGGISVMRERRYAYPLDVFQEQDGTYSAVFPGLPGGTNGETRAEVMERAEGLLVTSLAIFVEEGRPIPEPSETHGQPVIAVPALDAAKLALHDAMLEERISNIELGRRMGLNEKAVRRLRDPLHRSSIGKVEAALRALGRRLEVMVAA